MTMCQMEFSGERKVTGDQKNRFARTGTPAFSSITPRRWPIAIGDHVLLDQLSGNCGEIHVRITLQDLIRQSTDGALRLLKKRNRCVCVSLVIVPL